MTSLYWRGKMSKPNSPCKDCPDRHMGCHSECEGYKSFEAENEEYKAKRREALKKEYGSLDYVSILKNKQRKNKK